MPSILCPCGTRYECKDCPTCAPLKKPAIRRLALGKKMRKREVTPVIGLSPEAVRDGFEKSGVDKTYTRKRAQATARVRRRDKLGR
jgi:hypothetical protein